MTNNTALIVGDTGICGRHLVRHLTELGGWNVLGLSRSTGAFSHEHISADLTDRDSLNEALKAHNDITHVFYVGRSPQPDPVVECQTNTEMFVNVIEALEQQSQPLRHIHVMQGMKWYGSHAGAYRTPAREDDARHPSPNFYYQQQDWLSERVSASSWDWSALRPHQVVGFSDQYPHNIAAVLALYGSFCRHRGMSFDFPGSQECFDSVSMVTDANLLAEAMTFAATSDNAKNSAFNVGNGDYFRWRNVWPALAEFFAIPCGGVRTHSLHDTYDQSSDEWLTLCNQHGLRNHDMTSIGSWLYADFTFRAGWDDMANFSNIYEAGFVQWQDSERVLLKTLQTYRDEKIIP